MHIFNLLLEIIIGFSAGSIIAAGVFAFITTIGIITRIAAKTKTDKHIRLYEDCIVLGATLGNWIDLKRPELSFGVFGLILLGIFSGIFVGCLIMSLAETIDTLPVMIKNIKINKGLQYIILSMALGKMCGSWIYFFYQIG